MSRFYLRLTLIPIALFTLMLILIHAQPYDDHQLRELLLPEGCPSPCFMGIRPGVTTMDEAINLLQANQWIASVNKRAINNRYGFITWTWKEPKPTWASQNAIGEILITDKVVHAITISSEFALGETRLTLGLPNAESITTPQNSSGKLILYEAFYDHYGLITRSWQTCGVIEPLRKTIAIVSVESTHDDPRHVNVFNDLFRMC